MIGIVTSPNRALTRSCISAALAQKIGLHHLQRVCITFVADVAKNKNAETAPACGTDTESS
jgi:hypothetical protein